MDQISNFRRAAAAVCDLWPGRFHTCCDHECMPPSNVALQRPAESVCTLRCAFKAALFVLLALFVLYVPLGDPYTLCHNPKMVYSKQLAMCCICDIYVVTTNVACKSLEISQSLYKVISDLVYELKLKFYTLLDRLDRDDLCRTICCADVSSHEDLETKREHRACKCLRKCKYKSTNV